MCASGAKAQPYFLPFLARLKPCPFKAANGLPHAKKAVTLGRDDRLFCFPMQLIEF